MGNNNHNICNSDTNGEQYYDSTKDPIKALDIVNIGFSFTYFMQFCACFVFMLVVLGIMAAGSANTLSLIIISIPTLICCICASYNYYNYSKANSDYNTIAPRRPCKDPNREVVYR